MKKLIFPFLLLGSAIIFAQTSVIPHPQTVNHALFIKNGGQWPDKVLFLLQSQGVNTWITKNGLVFDYYRIDGQNKNKSDGKLTGIIKGQVISMSFKRSLTEKDISATGKSNAYYNYFLGNKQSRWATDVPAFHKILLHNVFENIDMELSVDNGQPRYNFIVQAGGNPEQIRMHIDGADRITVKDNSLVLTTQIGDKSHGDIVAFQNKETVACRVTIIDNNNLSFDVGSYDNSQPLYIDPLVYSTFIGASSEDVAMDVALGNDGTIYLAGYTWSLDFPIISGAYQHDFNGTGDAFLCGFSPDGTTLLFSTYLGGQLNDMAFNLAYNGDIILSGITYSDDFPVTANAFQNENNLGGDVFVVSLNSSGNNLNFSTFVGGFGTDYPTGMDVGRGILVGGYTTADDFPVTPDAFKSQYSGDGFTNDGFFFIMDNSGTNLLYSTYFGGYYEDKIIGVTFDKYDTTALYLTGVTMSSDFPISEDAYDQNVDQEHADAFLTCFHGTSIGYSTVFGGSSYDVATAITVNNVGDMMVSGETYSDDFPLTANAFMSSYQLLSDGFLTVFHPDGNPNTNDLRYSSYFGGAGDDIVSDISLKNQNLVYLSGSTNSFNFPTTEGAVSTEQIGNEDAFLIRFNTDNGNVDYSTYLGGSFSDGCSAIAEKSNGDVVMTGSTYSFNFPVTANAFESSYHSENNSDAFLSIVEVVPTFINQHIAKSNHLGQNRPNPFSEDTAIPYEIRVKSDVVFQVTDETGKVVFTKTFASVPPGKHTIEVNGNRLSTGIYIYTVKTNRWSESRTFVLQ